MKTISPLSKILSKRNLLTKRNSQEHDHDDNIDRTMNNIEAYVGPIGSLLDMEGGIAIAEIALHVLTGPSLVAPGRGLFLSIYNEDEESEDIVEEVVIPQGTPLCGYARGHFASEEAGDKSVGFVFTKDAPVFYEKQLMGISEAIQTANSNLWGHRIVTDDISGEILSITPDEKFNSRIFIPDKEENENEFAATCLGVYANDLAFDPDADEEKYLETSDQNNILQLIWRLAKDEKNGNLVPTWPVVVAKKDLRLVNTVPMEVGLQYGFRYWEYHQKINETT